MTRSFIASVVLVACLSATSLLAADFTVGHLRCEYLKDPLGLDEIHPRLSWQLHSEERGIRQTAYQIQVASSPEALANGRADLWDSGKVSSDNTLFIPYAGKALVSRQPCHWHVLVWGETGSEPVRSAASTWTMGLLSDDDWSAQYISYRDTAPIHKDTAELYLPAARQYRKEFSANKIITRATIYATALGIYELHLNGQRVGDAYFAPGWTDYRQRAYYNTYDVTQQVRSGANALGAWVADGWYSGYVGFGLLTGMGTEKTGRAVYGKTPAVLVQLEIEYSDGTRQVVGTDSSWKVTGEGPIQAADLLMGEEYDARREQNGWTQTGFDDAGWGQAILASENGQPTADFYEFHNPHNGSGVQIEGEPRQLGFHRPQLQSFPGVPVRVTEELAAKKIMPREDGVYLFDLGQNFAGTIRLQLKEPAGQRIQIRYGEMLHPDGRLMTENLRKARATDIYICSGKPQGETFQPRFTFHGFQYVEVSGLTSPPTLESVTGLVLHSDTPRVSSFSCSDSMVNRLFQNVVWTQRANFLDLPTDCPQRDERMGWTGDAQAYVATAAYNADIGAFYTKWLRELMESQRPSGTFPGYAPFPFQHGWDFGTAWADAGVICPWTIWQAYGDTRVIEACWEPMVRFMQWRTQTSQDNLGIAHGNAWGDWLAQGASTPLEYVDTIYFAISARLMSEMAAAIGHNEQSQQYAAQFERIKSAFATKYLNEDGSVNVNTQTAQALALFADLIPAEKREATGRHLAAMIAANGNHMSTGFLGTRPLLPVLSATGQNDLAVFLLQSREFPSWGYEITNGATTIWERWDSYTKEDGFGRHNASMNSFSHYAFGAVCEWMFRTLAGIDSGTPGYGQIIIAPHPAAPGSNGMHDPIQWVEASYDSIRGTIASNWKIADGKLMLSIDVPANTTAEVHVPAPSAQSITESGHPLDQADHVRVVRQEGDRVVVSVDSGHYAFVVDRAPPAAEAPLRTSKPADTSLNPQALDVRKMRRVQHWDFRDAGNLAAWNQRSNLRVDQRDGKAILVAIGPDPQVAVHFAPAIQGSFVVQLNANPHQGAESQFFWAGPGHGFNAQEQIKRHLNEAEQVNPYLFGGQSNQPVDRLRFDPFESFDAAANVGHMDVESISIYVPAGGQ